MSNIWHDLRAKNIGGSDIAALFGESPYSSYYKLWHEKKGLIKSDFLENNDRIQAGQFLEAGVIAWANKKWDYDFYQPEEYVEHASIKGMACTPDAYSKINFDIMAQIKCVDGLQFKKEWDYEGEEITKAPLHILLQVQHEMECSQRKISYLIVMVGGNRIFKMKCEHDKEIAGMLRNKVVEFWAREDAPEPDFKKDQKSIKTLRNNLRMTEQEDYSKDRKYHSLVKRIMKLKHDIKTKQDKYSLAEAELYHLSLNYEEIRCKDLLVKFIKRKDGVTILKIIDEEILL